MNDVPTSHGEPSVLPQARERRSSALSSPSLKGALFAGAAAVALGAPTDAAAQPVPPEKWDAYIDLTGRFGNYTAGEIGLFIPLWQSPDSILFADLRGKMTSESTQEGNFGLGYRTQVNQDWILGVNAFFDIHNSDADNTFIQGGVGVEALTEDWDFRLNGYFPESDDKAVGGMPLIQVQGNTIQLLTGIEKALWGFDGEVGYRLPFFDPDGDTEIRVFAGGFYFDADGVEGLMGPRLRLEARIYDLDFLSNGSRLTLGAEVTHDDVRNLRGFGSVSVRVPLQLFGGSAAPKLAGLDRRMVDPVRRDFDIVTNVGYGNPEDIFVENSEVAVDTIVFGTNGGGGPGTYEGAPDSVADAFAFLGGSEGIVVVDDSGGTYNTAGLTLQDGQVLLGGGTTVKVTGAVSGEQTYFSPKGFRPTINGTNGANPLITINDDNVVAGLDLTGAFDEGIAGTVYTNFAIVDNSIFGAGGDGVDIEVVNPSSSGRIRDNYIYNATGDGIDVDILADDGAYHHFDLYIYDNDIFETGDDGISVYSRATNNSTLSQNIEILYNDVGRIGDDIGGTGIEVRNVVDTGGFIDQGGTVTIADNDVMYTGGDGILVYNTIDDGTLDQHLIIDDNYVDDIAGAGIRVATFATDVSNVYQDIEITDNGMNEVAGHGIEVYTFANEASDVYQYILIDGNYVGYGVGGNGIHVHFEAYGQGTDISIDLTISDNTIGANSSTDHGIRVETWAYYDSYIGQYFNTVSIVDNTISGVEDDGIHVYNFTGNSSGTYSGRIWQTLTIDGNDIYDVGDDGIRIENVAFYESDLLPNMTLTQTVSNNTIYGFGGSGVKVLNEARYGATIDSSNTLTISNNTISYGYDDGIYVRNEVDDDSAIYLTARITDNTIYSIGVSGDDNGIEVFNDISDEALLDLDLEITGNDVYDIYDDGVEVYSRLFDEGVMTGRVEISGNTVNYTGGDGIDVGFQLNDDSAVYDDAAGGFALTIDDNTISEVDYDGVYLDIGIYDDAGARMTVSIDGNSIYDTGDDGIGVYVDVYTDSSLYGGLELNLSVDDNTIYNVGDDGVDINFDLDGYSISLLTVSVSGNDIYNTSAYGIDFDINASESSLVQFFHGTFSNNTIDDTGTGGIGIYLDFDENSRGSMTFDIDNNTITYTSRDGIELDLNASESALISQLDVNMDGNTISNSGYDGIDFDIYATDGADVHFDLVFENNTVDYSNYNGVEIDIESDDSANIVADLDFIDNVIDENRYDGIQVTAYTDGGTLFLDVLFDGNTVTDNGVAPVYNGITIIGNYGGGTLDITANFVDNTIDNSYGHGIELDLDGGTMNVGLSGRNELTDNNLYGVYAIETGGTMTVIIGGETYFDGNSGYVLNSGAMIIYLP